MQGTYTSSTQSWRKIIRIYAQSMSQKKNQRKLVHLQTLLSEFFKPVPAAGMITVLLLGVERMQ